MDMGKYSIVLKCKNKAQTNNQGYSENIREKIDGFLAVSATAGDGCPAPVSARPIGWAACCGCMPEYAYVTNSESPFWAQSDRTLCPVP